jgi:anti-sigma28 factor (negative regulator of flagellin synthesis)
VTKISGDSIKPGTPTGIQEIGAGTQPAVQAPTPPSARAVKVEMTPLANGGQPLDKVLNGVSVVDAASVETTKLAIIEGRFRIDSEVVATKLLATVREHLVSQQKR